MGSVCTVAFMGAPVILIEKLCNGEESLLALQRLRQVVASGVCEGKGGGRVSGGGVEVVEKAVHYPGESAPFPAWLAKDEDIRKIDINDPNIPQVGYALSVCLLAAELCNKFNILHHSLSYNLFLHPPSKSLQKFTIVWAQQILMYMCNLIG